MLRELIELTVVLISKNLFTNLQLILLFLNTAFTVRISLREIMNSVPNIRSLHTHIKL